MSHSRLLGILAVAGAAGLGWSSPAKAECTHKEPVFIDTIQRTFTSGAAWNFDIWRRQCEGLEIALAFYKPAGSTVFNKVLHSATLAELQVVYSMPNGERGQDVTTTVLGLGNIEDAPPGGEFNSAALPFLDSECAMADRKDDGRICVRNHDEGYRWKFKNTFKKAEAVEVMMSAMAGDYVYIHKWAFHDDGSIQVRMGLTGRLAATTQNPDVAPRFGHHYDPLNGDGNIGLAHWHNLYYRLDFDIGYHLDDQVLRRSFDRSTTASPDGGCGATGQCGKIVYSPILNETAQEWRSGQSAPGGEDSWLVIDKLIDNGEGRNIGYELLPQVGGRWRGMVASSEPWAGHELWVTGYNPCEMLALANLPPFIPAGCPATHVQEMIADGASVDGEDVVVWYANRLFHYPREEDMERMPIEWMGFDVRPRSLTATNPSP
jgi:primary-amine oxidase